MGRYTDTIIFLIRDGNLLKPFPSISITVPKVMFVRVRLVMNLRMRLERF
jgi:hypothetical protein